MNLKRNIALAGLVVAISMQNLMASLAPPSVVPEPASVYALAGAAVATLLLVRRRKLRK